MQRYDILNIIGGAIRRGLATANEKQAFDAAEEVLMDFEIAGLRLKGSKQESKPIENIAELACAARSNADRWRRAARALQHDGIHAPAVVAAIYAAEELVKWREATFSPNPRQALVGGRPGSHSARANVFTGEVVGPQFGSAAVSDAVAPYDLSEPSDHPDPAIRKQERVERNARSLPAEVSRLLLEGVSGDMKELGKGLYRVRTRAAYASEKDPTAIDRIGRNEAEAVLSIIDRAFRLYGFMDAV
jgi:hypothetical protein